MSQPPPLLNLPKIELPPLREPPPLRYSGGPDGPPPPQRPAPSLGAAQSQSAAALDPAGLPAGMMPKLVLPPLGQGRRPSLGAPIAAPAMAPAALAAMAAPAASVVTSWDLVLVLPLPEDKAAAAAEAKAGKSGCCGCCGSKPKAAKHQPLLAEALHQKKRGRATPGELLRHGLHLSSDEVAGSDWGSTGWLIDKLRERIASAGLRVKVLKLLPVSDADEEDEGEREIASDYMVTLLCIGTDDPADPRLTNARLMIEAQRAGASVRGLNGGLRQYDIRHPRAFVQFKSALRQKLIRSILGDPAGPPLPDGPAGAGLDIASLLGSGCVKELIYLHDDDERDALYHGQVTSCKRFPGVTRMGKKWLRQMHDYLGAEVTFYFAWAAWYTRWLWFPAILGAALSLFDTFWLRPEIADGGGDRISYIWVGVHGGWALILVLWSSVYLATWTRRSKRLQLDWAGPAGVASFGDKTAMGSDAVNPDFKAEAMRAGFYTAGDVWVDLTVGADAPSGSGAANAPPKMRIGRHKRAVVPERVSLIRNAAQTREREPWASRGRRICKEVVSTLILLTMVATCVGFTLATMLLRLVLRKWRPDSLFLVSIINSVVIMIFNMVWKSVAISLNNWENHRLERNTQNALVYKMFVFQFVNCYFILFYIAYGKRLNGELWGYEDKCSPLLGDDPAADGVIDANTTSCIDELRLQLFSQLLLNLVIGNIVELASSIFKRISKGLIACAKVMMRGRKVAPDPDGDKPDELDEDAAEKAEAIADKHGMAALSASARRDLDDHRMIGDYEKPPNKALQYGLSATFYEYNELVLQFGYVMLFSFALPGGALLALLNNIVEIRTDSYKMLRIERRVRALSVASVGGIGAWRRILVALTYISVITNALLVCYTTDLFERLDAKGWPQLAVFFIMEHTLIFLKVFIDRLVPDVPRKVWSKLALEEWIESNSADASDERESE